MFGWSVQPLDGAAGGAAPDAQKETIKKLKIPVKYLKKPLSTITQGLLSKKILALFNKNLEAVVYLFFCIFLSRAQNLDSL